MQYSKHTQNAKTKTMITKRGLGGESGNHIAQLSCPVCPTRETPPRGSHYPALVLIIPMQVYKFDHTHICMCVTTSNIYI